MHLPKFYLTFYIKQVNCATDSYACHIMLSCPQNVTCTSDFVVTEQIVASCAYRQIVAVAACHSIPKRLPLYSQLTGSDIHHIDILGPLDWI